MKLRTFEMTWWGWQQYLLESEGAVCQALLSLTAKEHIMVQMLGEARMERSTKLYLEHTIDSRRVQISTRINLNSLIKLLNK